MPKVDAPILSDNFLTLKIFERLLSEQGATVRKAEV